MSVQGPGYLITCDRSSQGWAITRCPVLEGDDLDQVKEAGARAGWLYEDHDHGDLCPAHAQEWRDEEALDLHLDVTEQAEALNPLPEVVNAGRAVIEDTFRRAVAWADEKGLEGWTIHVYMWVSLTMVGLRLEGSAVVHPAPAGEKTRVDHPLGERS